MKTVSCSLVVALVVLSAPALRAVRLMPDPRVDVAEIRGEIGRHFTQPVSLGELKFETERRSALRVALHCEAELVLGESFYVEVPRTDAVFTSVRERLAELEMAKKQLDLVPRDFIASIGGQKSSAGLSFLQNTFIRTTVPAGTKARVKQIIDGSHGLFFWSGRWEWSCPEFVVTTWSGRPIAAFKQPLRVDTPDFERQLTAFLDSARKTLEEVDEISTRYLAKVEADRNTLFEALPVGAVLRLDVKEEAERPLFLEVREIDAQRGLVEFSVSSGYASKPARKAPLVGVHPDAGAELRDFIAQRRLAKQRALAVEVPAEPVVESPAPVVSSGERSAPPAPSVARLLRGATSVRLAQAGAAPMLLVNEETPAVALARVAPDLVAGEKERFQRETAELLQAFEPGRVYHCTINNRTCALTATTGEGAARRFVLQLDEDGNERVGMSSSLLDVEREHPGLRLAVAGDAPYFVGQVLELIRTGAETARVDGRFGAVNLQLTTEKVLRPSGRIVAPERNALLNELSTGRAPGLYQKRAAAFEVLATAPAPTQSTGSGFGNTLVATLTLGLGSLPTATLQFPAAAEQTRVKRDLPLYQLRGAAQLKLLKLTKNKSGYEFTGSRAERGYGPRAQDLVPVPMRQLEDGVFEYSLKGIVMEGVCALVESTEQGLHYHLITLEP